MAMVFCRGCGKEIHETAQVCPLCGAAQGFPYVDSTRSTVKLIGWAIVWLFVFWFGSFVVIGAVAGVIHTQDAHDAGARAVQVLSTPMFFVSLCASVVLTIFGKLPGTKKPSIPKPSA
jgi:hypothetical protein